MKYQEEEEGEGANDPASFQNSRTCEACEAVSS
jgi:hypothetical protein